MITLKLINKIYYKNKQERVLYSILLATLIQAIVMILMYLNSDFNDIINTVFDKDQRLLEWSRVSGLQDRGGDGLSMNQCLGALTGLVLINKGSVGLKRKILIFISISTIVISSLLAGRSGFLLFIISTIVALYYYKFYKKKIFYYSLSIIMVLVCLLNNHIITRALDVSRGYDDPIFRALEPLRAYTTDSSIRTSSTDILLQRMIIFPSGYRFIFGNFEYGREGSEYISTDIGYLRLLFGSGIVGLILLVAPFIYLLSSRYKDIKPIVIFGLIGNIKIIYLITGSFIYLLTIMYFLNINED